jgi:hypothetical protein
VIQITFLQLCAGLQSPSRVEENGMPKELIIEITTGIVVLGSVFGGSHLRKLSQWIEDRLDSKHAVAKSAQPAIPIPLVQDKTAPPSTWFEG